MKFLIDTNIVIQLEDAKEVQKRFSDLLRKAHEHSVAVFVHEASIEDIGRDKDEKRRRVTLSKLDKFQKLEGVLTPTDTELAALYGPLPKPNDVCDAKMLHALSLGAVEIFVTEDDKLHRRAKAAGLSDQVMTVADALSYLRTTFEPHNVFLPSVREVKAYNVNFKDPIFVELGMDYPVFEDWTLKCRKEHRPCWVISDGDKIAGIVIRKDEQYSGETQNLGPKIMKICTFKVSEDYRGQKLGEQLLKQIFWHAQRNKYDLVYLTVYEKQDALIRLIEDYGFRHTLNRSNGERVYEKVIGHGVLIPRAGQSALEAARENYPRFVDSASVRKFIIPIEQSYHQKLFPEVGAPAPASGAVGEKPGNTIKKVYICHAMSDQMRPGDLVFFYMKKTSRYGSQSLTSVGVIESVRVTGDVEEARRWTAKRSVFSDAELATWVVGNKPLKVIDFLLVGHLEPTIPLAALTTEHIMTSWPQSVTLRTEKQYAALKPHISLGFEF